MSFMKKLILIILLLIGVNLTYCQIDYSIHSLEFYENFKRKKIKIKEFSIIVDGTKINGEKIGDNYRFPIIDSVKTFEFNIKTNKMDFVSAPHKTWVLNNNSNIIIGKITRIDKLFTVAQYKGLQRSDVDYEVFSKRFFLPNNHTIDINKPEKIKRLDYMILNPIFQGNRIYILLQKIIELKK